MEESGAKKDVTCQGNLSNQTQFDPTTVSPGSFSEEATPVSFKDKTGIQPKERPFDVPEYYGDNKITLMVRDPWTIFSYWETSDDVENKIKDKILYKPKENAKEIEIKLKQEKLRKKSN